MPGHGDTAMNSSVRTEVLGHSQITGDPYSVFILKEGYMKSDEEGNARADGTITLVKGPQIIVVDTGGPWDREYLLQQLSLHGLQPTDVTHVVCTHGHSDHVGNLNLFTQATILVSYDISRGDCYLSHDFRAGVPFQIDSSVEIFPTPGHTGSDTSVLVRGCILGNVVVAGDLFEREGDEGSWEDFSENPTLQLENRQKVLQMADIVIPGHGAPFRVIRNAVETKCCEK